jgi:hypothetical protein
VPRAIRRCSVLWGVALCAVLVGPVAVAHATDNNLRATLNSYSAKINNDENAISRGLKAYPRGKFKPLARALKREIPDLRALRSRLAADSPSSRKGTKAKRDLVKGLRLIITAYATLRRDVLAARGGPLPASLAPAIKRGLTGRKLFKTGYNLLK